jgi:hypothetical protein
VEKISYKENFVVQGASTLSARPWGANSKVLLFCKNVCFQNNINYLKSAKIPGPGADPDEKQPGEPEPSQDGVRQQYKD